jgi:hypothetical protein
MHREAQSAKAAAQRGTPRLAPLQDYEFAEALQISEYGTQPTDEWLREMFDFAYH